MTTSMSSRLKSLPVDLVRHRFVHPLIIHLHIDRPVMSSAVIGCGGISSNHLTIVPSHNRQPRTRLGIRLGI